MPVSVVVGGQYGSEGKGKVALELARMDPSTTMVVRPGGTNSGHTGYSRNGERFVLRQLPAAAIDGHLQVVFPAGAYIDVGLLLREIDLIGLAPSQVAIDPKAQIIRPEHVAWETDAKLTQNIGSTNSGTGAAVISRTSRFAPQHPLGVQASEIDGLSPYIADTAGMMGSTLRRGERILIEGTQGFELSVFHSESWPKCTSRDTTAAGFLSEAGLSPLHVDRVVLVLRCHPIRVAGDSGILTNETDWGDIAKSAGAPSSLAEFTSVTHKLRRVGRFDPRIVRRAILANAPTDIVLNHIDQVDWSARENLTEKALTFIRDVEDSIGQCVHWVGSGPQTMQPLRNPSLTQPI